MKKPVAKKLSLELETIAALSLDQVGGGAAGTTGGSHALHCQPQSNLLGRTCLLCVPDETKGPGL